MQECKIGAEGPIIVYPEPYKECAQICPVHQGLGKQ